MVLLNTRVLPFLFSMMGPLLLYFESLHSVGGGGEGVLLE